jgi:endonuclease-3 related protein
VKNIAKCVYDALLEIYGHQNWWPSETTDETIIGAILTQNTNWTNVEKAINNLKNNNLCSLKKINKTNMETLTELIRPSGYFNQKAQRLKNFAKKVNINELKKKDTDKAREFLLSLNGIGPETADSILLYALNKPIFVIDAYTIRLFTRLGVILKTYSDYQNYFMQTLPLDTNLFNEYHALIVNHAKHTCQKKTKCEICVLRSKIKCNNTNNNL